MSILMSFFLIYFENCIFLCLFFSLFAFLKIVFFIFMFWHSVKSLGNINWKVLLLAKLEKLCLLQNFWL